MNSVERLMMNDKKLLVTGAASGIGHAISTLLAARGARLALLDRSEAVIATARDLGGIPTIIDLMQTRSIPEVVERAASSIGGLDGIVNCAGVLSVAPLANLDESDWHRSITINLTAPYLICRAALPWLHKSSDASIVNIASGVGIRPVRVTTPAYGASKAGLLGLTRTLAANLAPAIRVNAVCPGLTDTPMVVPTNQEDQRALMALYPLGRAAAPCEVAEVAAFLLSPAASYVTGASYTVDGGRTLY